MTRVRQRATAGRLLHLGRDRFTRIELAAGDDHVGTRSRETEHHRPTESSAPSGDEGDPPLQVEELVDTWSLVCGHASSRFVLGLERSATVPPSPGRALAQEHTYTAAMPEGDLAVGPPVITARHGATLVVTLNRPERRNALTPEAYVRMADVWYEFRDDPELRVAILTGAGEQAFTVGADLRTSVPLLSGARAPQDEWDERFLADLSLMNDALLRDLELTEAGHRRGQRRRGRRGHRDPPGNRPAGRGRPR